MPTRIMNWVILIPFLATMSSSNLRISSFNCRGLSIYRDITSVNNDIVRNLSGSSDIILLQETWLFKQDLGKLNDFIPEFYGYGESTIDASMGTINGHPPGGVAILWKRNLNKIVKPLNLGYDWLCGVCIKNENWAVYILCVYMPCQSRDNYDEFINKCGILLSVINDIDCPNIIIAGDYNANVNDANSMFGAHLREVCNENNLLIPTINDLPIDSYTFISEIWHSMSWIDHCICTESCGSLLDSFEISYDLSDRDHIPFSFSIDVGCVPRLVLCDHINTRSINWDRMTCMDIFDYKTELEISLEAITCPIEALACRDSFCTNVTHRDAIDNYFNDIASCINRTSETFCPERARENFGAAIPGWNLYVREHRERSIEAHISWVRGGRPESGPIYESKMSMHRAYKNAISRVRANEDSAVKDSLAMKMLMGPSKVFWRDVKRVSGIKSHSNIIEGCDDSNSICDLWQSHYESVFNCLEPTSAFTTYEPEPFMTITPNELCTAFGKLKNGKASGPDMISAENIKYGGPVLFNHLLLLFNSFLTHGFLPEKFMSSSISPVIKDSKGDITSRSNYRPICISSTVSKLFEFVLLARLEPHIDISANQFGFQSGIGIDSCIYSLKENIIRVDRLGSNAFVCLLDASKAFDRINHEKLFFKLSQRGVPNYLIRTLKFWYNNQSMFVKWGSVQSSAFKCSNGIKQGGVLSPLLFNVYFDDLSKELNKLDVGPQVGDKRCNHFMYADDIALFAISVTGLQRLINICLTYGLKFDILFNPAKTKLIVFRNRNFRNVIFPAVRINGQVIEEVTESKYLGYWLCNDLSDDLDIQRQTRYIYAQGNGLIRKFHNCTVIRL